VAIKPTGYPEARGLESIAGRDFLGRLPPMLIKELADSGREVRYPAGSVLVAPSHGPAILVSGALRYFLTDPDGRQVTIRYIGPGGLVGTVIREESNTRGSVEILADSVLLHLDAEHLWSLTAGQPEMAEALLSDAVSRMRAAYRALGARAFKTERARVAGDIIDRTTLAGPLHAGARVEVTQQALADAVGSVREVVARALAQLRRRGVITSSRGRITILDPPALRRAASDLI
jgi:CRP/FNR family cyclic AMP-dependent transcriptional regulator